MGGEQLDLFGPNTELADGLNIPRRGAGRMEHYGPWPAPGGVYYSHYVVWRTCVAWELRDWLRHRNASA